MPTETEKSREKMQPTDQPVALLFINTTHPSDATTRGSLSKIRSHAAREVRSRVLKSRKTVFLPGNIRKTRSVEQPQQNASDTSKQSHPRTCISLASSNDHDYREPLPGPHQNKGLSRVAQSWGSARPFSDTENVLLDHCESIPSKESRHCLCDKLIDKDLNYIVPFRNGSCHQNKSCSGEGFIAIQLKYWIPFALSDHGLIAGLLLQSCRSLEALNPCQSYTKMSTEYRLQCIQSTNAALSANSMQISDATIAKVMIMASEEVSILVSDRNTCVLAINRLTRL
jgi:hypothetical protein